MKLLFILLSISLILSDNGTNKKDTSLPSDANVIFKAILNGRNDGPAFTSRATGTAILTFNTATKIFSLSVMYTGPSASYGHINNGSAGFSKLSVFPLSNLNSPITYTSTALNAAQEADLYANHYDISLHSKAYPDGEIRGVLIRQEIGGIDGGTPPPPPGY